MKNKNFLEKEYIFQKILKNTKINLDHISFLRPANKIKLNDYKKVYREKFKKM